MSHTQPKPGDKKAAYVGLIVSAVSILLILYATSKWTASRFEGHAAGSATPAATTGH